MIGKILDRFLATSTIILNVLLRDSSLKLLKGRITVTNGGDHPLNMEVFIEIAPSLMSTCIISKAVINETTTNHNCVY